MQATRSTLAARLLAALLLLILCLAAPLAWAGSFLAFSDVHYDPLADPLVVPHLAARPAAEWPEILSRQAGGLPGYGKETNQRLLASALRQMRQVEPKPDFIIFTGDLLAHMFNQRYVMATGDTSRSGLESFIAKTFTTFADQVAQVFPGVPVYLCLGNNDSYEGDYMVAPGGRFLKDSAEIWASRLLPQPALRQEFLAQYPQAGYFSLSLSSSLRLVSLNSVLFSVKYPKDPAGRQAALGQLDWLEEQLSQARAASQKVLLLAHIPPGVNVYNTLRDPENSATRMRRVTSFWAPEYTERFKAIVRAQADTLLATLCGHTHMDDFRLFSMPGQVASGFLHIIPALSPQFGNNPGFQVFSYQDQPPALTDYATHYLDVGASEPLWRWEYGFNQAYGLKGVNAQSVAELHRRIWSERETAHHYYTHYRVSDRLSPFQYRELTAYWCGMGYLMPNDFQDAFNRLAPSRQAQEQ